MEPYYFINQKEFRNWLEENFDKKEELLVGFYKVASGRQNMTWSQSVDEALCFGWIDSIRRSVDNDRYCIRFTPRRPGSRWSDVNVRKVEELTKKGLMHQAGIDSYNKRKKNNSGIYRFETDRNSEMQHSQIHMDNIHGDLNLAVTNKFYTVENQSEKFPSDWLQHFHKNETAWNFFNKQPPSYRKSIFRWIMDAKTEVTRQRRLEKVISESEMGQRLK